LYTPERPNRCPHCVFQLIQRVPFHACTGSNFDRCADPPWLRCNGQTKICVNARALETHPNRNNKSRNRNCDVISNALVLNQIWRCFGKVARVWLNGRSVRIMALSARLDHYHPHRAGPPNPTQSSAMISSPAAPTAGLSIPALRRTGQKRASLWASRALGRTVAMNLLTG